MKKHKIIDSVFFYDELEMLMFRLTELNEDVDQFIIMESGIDFAGNPKPFFFKENEHLFEKWKDKITYLPSYNLTSKDFDNLVVRMIKVKTPIKNITKEINRYHIQLNQLVLLYDHLLSLDLYMEDLLMISDVDEIPDLRKISEIKERVIFSPVLLRQKNFIWSTKFINFLPNMGTLCLQYTDIVITPSKLFMNYFDRLNYKTISFEIVDSGYHFSHFYDINKTKEKFKLIDPKISDSHIENCWNNLLSVTTDKNNSIYGLLEYDGELPKNIGLLKNQPIGREFPKKHLVLFNSNSKSLNEIIENDWDSVYIINFIKNSKISFKNKVSDKTIEYNILIPNSKYYEVFVNENTIENFQKMFGVNEINKILSSDLPISKDLFIFCNGENPDNLITIAWSELREGFIYDKISEIL
jgi:beta-1,4-mannosyl-glycoprotein beta-1,4-N-acetylglucosaminyltransferase